MPFTSEHHQLLQAWGGQQYDANNRDHVDARLRLRTAWFATEEWATGIQQSEFATGSVKIRRAPLLRQVFLNHTWARIYPSTESPRWIAYTVGINIEHGYIVKIDLINRQIDEEYRDRMRISYDRRYGAFDRSPIAAVLPKTEGLRMKPDELVKWSLESIKKFRPTYLELSSNPHQIMA